MLDFVEGGIDIFVIIENGIDIPNANTIIILNARQTRAFSAVSTKVG